MGSDSGCLQESGCHFNGLIPNKTASLTRVLDMERWTIAEQRTAELIARIQPDQPSWKTRNAIASYVQRLITESIPCVVLIYGSVPLKTYLPDGDIDLTVFTEDRNINDNCAAKVTKILEKAGTDADAEYQIKEVQLIPAEVKVVKCLVDDIVVDISFGQLGGLCTLSFLEQVDQHINQNHLFKRSIILIKAWCYYESRILGAYHGLLSTYALETLILYIFHIFNNSFAGPLEVLYCFLEFFSSFDWDNFCISLQGPVPIRSLPDMTADPPRKYGGALFLRKRFYYSVCPSTPEIKEEFCSKHLNIIDFLRINNNLGRSVSRGNFFRIRSAFTLGANRLAGILDCPLEDVVTELNRCFATSWEMNGKVHRPDTHFVHTSGFVNWCHMEKGDELDDPAIIYADSSFTLHNPESRLFCSEYMERKQNPFSLETIACCHSKDRKQHELIIENGDLVGRCGGRKEILCSSFTNSMFKVSSGKLKDGSPLMSNELLDDGFWNAFTMDHKPVIDHTQCQTQSHHRNAFQHFCHKVNGGKEDDRFWYTEISALLPTEALLTYPPTDFSFSIPDCVGSTSGKADRCNDILGGVSTSHLCNMLYARSCQSSDCQNVLPEPAATRSSVHHSNKSPSSPKIEMSCSSRRQKGMNRNHRKEQFKQGEVDSNPQAAAAHSCHWEKPNSMYHSSAGPRYNNMQWIALEEEPSIAQPKRYVRS
ncbi:hypothetical protein V2J09_009149 [Rumex salicifolius]